MTILLLALVAYSEAFFAIPPTKTKTININNVRSSPIYSPQTCIQYATKKNDSSEDMISDFCQGTNEFWKGLVIEPVKKYVEVQPAETTVTSMSDVFTKLTSPPEIPGIPRPVWLTILGSVPTALGWYGYYKFSVEEELYQYEMQETGKVSGCGGYGTLFP